MWKENMSEKQKKKNGGGTVVEERNVVRGCVCVSLVITFVRFPFALQQSGEVAINKLAPFIFPCTGAPQNNNWFHPFALNGAQVISSICSWSNN